MPSYTIYTYPLDIQRLWTTLFIVALATLTMLPILGRPAEAHPGESKADLKRAKGELLVTYPGEDKELEQSSGGQVEEKIPKLNTRLVAFPELKEKPSGRVVEALERKKAVLAEKPSVVSVDYNYIRSIVATNDAYSTELWGLEKIRAEQTWGAGSEGEKTLVSVVDTGVAIDHPDLSGAVSFQHDFVAEDGVAQDDHGHGTHVAGTIAARANNSVGVAGACPGCSLISAKALDASGNGTDADIAEAIIYSADKGARVINLSLGAHESSSTLQQAVQYAIGRGALVVAAAGNSGTDAPFYPAAYGEAVAVSATTHNDMLADFSNYGSYIDLAAPGQAILSTSPGDGYATMSGTSMAAPHVSGGAALLFARGLSAGEVREDLQVSAADLGVAGLDPQFGHGRLDSYAAILRSSPPKLTVPTDTLAPSIGSLRPTHGAKTRDRTPTIRAIVTDNKTNLAKSHMTLILDGRKVRANRFSYNRATDKLTYTNPRLSYGRHSVRIVAIDAAQNRTSKAWTFRVVPRQHPGSKSSTDSACASRCVRASISGWISRQSPITLPANIRSSSVLSPDGETSRNMPSSIAKALSTAPATPLPL